MMQRRTARTGFRLPAIMLALLAVSSAASGQVIRIQSQITVEARQDVRLGDLATISGADRRTAEDLSNTIILSSVETSRKIKAEAVLLALLSQRGAASLGALQVSGAAECQVNVGSAPTAPHLSIPQPVFDATVRTVAIASPLTRSEQARDSAATPAGKTPTAQAQSTQSADAAQTLSQIIAARISSDSGIPASELRIGFETISPLMGQPLPPTRSWLCRPLTRTFLGTVQFEAQLVEGTRIVEKLTVSAKVERKVKVVIALTAVGRGDVISAKMVRTEDAWLDRSLPLLFTDARNVLELEAQRDIAVGSMLDQRDFKPALMAAKGDPVTVIYISGALKVKVRGRAIEQGKLHDQIEVRNESTGERYQAVLIAKHLAVVGGTLTEAEEKRLREEQ